MAAQRETERGYNGKSLSDEEWLIALLVSSYHALTTGHFSMGGTDSSPVLSKVGRILNMNENRNTVVDLDKVDVLRGRMDKRCVPNVTAKAVALAVFKGGFQRNKLFMSVYFLDHEKYRKFWDSHQQLCNIPSICWDESRDGCIKIDFDGDVSLRLSKNVREFAAAIARAEERNKLDAIVIDPMYTPTRYIDYFYHHFQSMRSLTEFLNFRAGKLHQQAQVRIKLKFPVRFEAL